jgi:ATP-dependent RNA helicase
MNLKYDIFLLPVGVKNPDETEFETSADVKVYPSFESMGLKENLLRGIFQYGFQKPSAIQQRAIVPMISGRDLIAQAQSGTGKTAFFSIGVLQSIDPAMK